MMSSLVKVVVPIVGGPVMAGLLWGGAPIASAVPDDGPLITTTCSYSQIVAALQVEAPELAAQLAQRPQAQAKLQELVSMPINQRKQRVNQWLDSNPGIRSDIEEKKGTPEGQQKVAMLRQIGDTCHKY